jgi:hypothetical protein
MPEGRPAIPPEIERAVKVEAGHRCAIPVCRQIPIELHHIVPWETVHEHTFQNIVALCPTDHARAEHGDIDRKALRMYKANLGVINSRYSDFERRVLEQLALSGANAIDLANADFQMLYLLRDGLLLDTGAPVVGGVQRVMRSGGFEMTPKRYVLTASGQDFIAHWVGGEALS